jgi:hypothetical protein
MSAEDAIIKGDVEKLRRVGTVVVQFGSAEDAAAWRAGMRRACRAADLRIRTGLANVDDRLAWVYHVHRVVTEAAERAARRAIEAAYDDDVLQAPSTNESEQSSAKCSELSETRRRAMPPKRSYRSIILDINGMKGVQIT